jgi:thiamine transport system substrate-binding protein
MKKLLLVTILAAAIVSGYTMYYSFNNFHRARNEAMPMPELNVFTHSSFMAPTGPGPEIAALFEPKCLCKIIFHDAGSGGLLLQKLLLPGQVRADVVIGLDQLLLKQAEIEVKWRNVSLPVRDWQNVVKNNTYAHFIPYDWAPLVFIVRGMPPKANSIRDFIELADKKSLVLPSPSLSTPGRQFLYWLFTFHSDDEYKKLLEGIAPKIALTGADWSQSYGLFRKGQGQFGLTYLTSLAYHWGEEKDRSYQPIIFKEAHPAQIEYAGVPDSCLSCGLAQRFTEFLTSEESQKLIMTKNYMLPVINKVTAGTIFAELPEVPVLSAQPMDAFLDAEKEILRLWQNALKR